MPPTAPAPAPARAPVRARVPAPVPAPVVLLAAPEVAGRLLGVAPPVAAGLPSAAAAERPPMNRSGRAAPGSDLLVRAASHALGWLQRLPPEERWRQHPSPRCRSHLERSRPPPRHCHPLPQVLHHRGRGESPPSWAKRQLADWFLAWRYSRTRRQRRCCRRSKVG